ncbi:hypothetical protein [Sphingobium yanoikuyae]|uniref:hypothetical protein n=1 Tax=Sphingobium yanoikuyae TaxID=13690 RepID=UPI00242AF613|nr:hypothetical protein [Sphingobium yanoikuyae]
MTAINMFVQPKGRAGYIVADCAITDADGTLRESCAKVAYNTGRFPYAIGVTGNVHPVIFVKAMGAANIMSMKQLIKRLPEVMRAAMASATIESALAPSEAQLGLKGVAWDFRAKRPIGFVMVSDPIMHPGCEPFTFYETDFALAKWDGAETVADMIGANVDITDPDKFDAERDGLKLIEKQRIQPCTTLIPSVDQAVKHRIGGEAHLYRVTKNGVFAEQLCDWPDEIGRKICPL